ncbi:hypothetical protein E2C01_064245 [Portunus trituberculatus]|uniref:Uncharacterized protein n=1 Tax=Portunus trituberculatus TaxID=210409 RepID=A0A5B7HCI5_PORTR|nr:hypothetical protein [Portunus trituberculatus]
MFIQRLERNGRGYRLQKRQKKNVLKTKGALSVLTFSDVDPERFINAISQLDQPVLGDVDKEVNDV